MIIDQIVSAIENLRTNLGRIEERIPVVPRHNYNASAAPTINDDIDDGWSVLSKWLYGSDLYICLDNSSGAADWQQLGSGSGIAHNTSAVAAPTINDDSGDGWSVLSQWLYNSELYVCFDASVGEAVWHKVTTVEFAAPVTYDTIAFVSSTAANVAASATIAPAKPSGLAAGHVMVATVFIDTSSKAVTPPSGWQTAEYSADGGMGLYTFYKVATSGDAAASNFTFTADSADGMVAVLSAWSGVDNTTPVQDSSQNTDNTGSSNTPTGLSVTSTLDNSMLIYSSAHQSGSVDYNSISGWSATPEEDLGTSPFGSAIQFYKTLATAGASGNVSGSLTAAQIWHTHMLVLNPAEL